MTRRYKFAVALSVVWSLVVLVAAIDDAHHSYSLRSDWSTITLVQDMLTFGALPLAVFWGTLWIFRGPGAR